VSGHDFSRAERPFLISPEPASAGGTLSSRQQTQPTAERETRQKKSSPSKPTDNLRPEYRRSIFGPMVRGKYHRQAVTASNLVLIDPELARIFPATAPCDC
jgi:hypothetical protein